MRSPIASSDWRLPRGSKWDVPVLAKHNHVFLVSVLRIDVCPEVDLVLNSTGTRSLLDLLEVEEDREGFAEYIRLVQDHEGEAVPRAELPSHRIFPLRRPEEESIQRLIAHSSFRSLHLDEGQSGEVLVHSLWSDGRNDSWRHDEIECLSSEGASDSDKLQNPSLRRQRYQLKSRIPQKERHSFLLGPLVGTTLLELAHSAR